MRFQWTRRFAVLSQTKCLKQLKETSLIKKSLIECVILILASTAIVDRQIDIIIHPYNITKN